MRENCTDIIRFTRTVKPFATVLLSHFRLRIPCLSMISVKREVVLTLGQVLEKY